MKKFLLSFFAITLILGKLWAGAGIWHSSINLTINGEYADYKITENSIFPNTELPKTVYITGTTLTINNIIVNVWKDNSGNICGGTYTLEIKDANENIIASKSLVITWFSEYESEYGGSKNQTWKNIEGATIDLSNIKAGTYTMTITGYATGNTNSSTDCSKQIQDNRVSCQLIVEEILNDYPDVKPEDSHSSSVPSECEDVMLQAFYWDSHDNNARYGNTKWITLNEQVTELTTFFDLIWFPPSAASSGGLGYHPYQLSNQNGNLGSEQQLKTLINNCHENNTKVIADIVVNHRDNKSSWCDFTDDDFGEYGQFQLTAAHIVGNDEVNFEDSGDCKGKATGADDTGEQYGGARDLDHTNPYVRQFVSAYLNWMKNIIGYDGWRWDVAKGFSPRYFNEYNLASNAYFSIGEYYDGNPDVLKGWIHGCAMNSLAFDFGTKFTAFNEGMASNNYYKLQGAGLLGAGYSKYAVTFIDNHDTFERGNGIDFANINNKDKILQANAYLLSMPGVPCVFYPHWKYYKDDIKPMIHARKACGIHSESRVTNEYVSYDKYEATIHGKNGTLILKVGSGSSYNETPGGYTKVASGNNYGIFINTTTAAAPKLIVTPKGGYYENGTQVTLQSTSPDVKIYYTLDGSKPTFSSAQYKSPIKITEDSVVLRVFAEYKGGVSEIQNHTYTTGRSLRSEGIKVSLYKPNNWNQVYLWAWDNADNNIFGDQWPGKPITNEGNGWWSHTFDLDVFYANILFNNGDTSNTIKTADVKGVVENTCYYFEGANKAPRITNNCLITTNYTQPLNSQLIIYPNPTQGELQIESNDIIKIVRIINTTGIIVNKFNINTTQTHISISNIPSGLYLLQAIKENGIINQTIVKQ